VNEASTKLVEQMRRESLALNRLNRTTPVQGTRQEIHLPGRTIHTVLYPAGQKNAPIVFAFHGGGFVFGGCALDDALHNTIRHELGANVVSVGYRKGENNPFPRAVNDAFDTVKHYLDDPKGRYDFDQSRVAVFGSSAGANLAVAASILAHRRKEFKIGMQILNYPFLDMATPPEDKGYTSTDLVRARFFNAAYAQPDQRKDPLVSPVLAGNEDFDKAMRAVVSLAEVDPLRAEGQFYTEQLRARDVQVAERVFLGQSHGYLEYAFRDVTQGYCPPPIEAAAENGSLYAERDATVNFIKESWQVWLST